MSRFVTSILALVLVLSPARAWPQRDDLPELNKQALAALVEKRYDEGIAILQRMLEQNPRDRGTAYNLACAYSLKNELDKSFEWLNKAVDWGWGSGQDSLAGTTKLAGHVEMTRTDPDLENLRKDPRFDALIKRMETRAKKAEEYCASAAVYIPAKIAAAAEIPLLVVLHDTGSSKDQVIAGKWKAIADELGTALIAPSGKILLEDDPTKGMAWWDDAVVFQQKPWTFEKSISDAVSAFKKEHKLEKNRVLIAGEGMGAIVAFDVAVGSPGLYKGALGWNGALLPDFLNTKAPAAGKAGLKLALLLDPVASKKVLPPDQDIEKVIARWNQSLQKWGMQGVVKAFTPDPKDPEQLDKVLAESLKRLAPTPGSADAGAAK